MTNPQVTKPIDTDNGTMSLDQINALYDLMELADDYANCWRAAGEATLDGSDVADFNLWMEHAKHARGAVRTAALALLEATRRADSQEQPVRDHRGQLGDLDGYVPSNP